MKNILSIESPIYALLLSIFLWSGNITAEELPQYSSDKHIGVGSCSGSTCHGSVSPWQKSNVLQNEYVTWTREDAHSKAYKILFNKESKRIVRNLGLKEPAHEAKLCLDCHADNVPEDKRGERFQISDGVGCEACHGGAERWIETHTTGKATHKKNISEGLYPTEDPVARATLCYSCHFGDDKKLVTHRIMGAGHPRMSFELDTFSAIQPAHYKVDKDYAERKKTYSGVQIWAIGQAIAMRENLDLLMDPKRGSDGVFPELVLFDCHACHHTMSDKRWSPRSGTGLPPGVVRINDANFIMLRHIMKVVDAGMATKLHKETRSLHRSVIKGNTALRQRAADLRKTTSQSIDAIAKHDFTTTEITSVLVSIIKEGLRGEYQDYAAAEQTTMAAGNVVAVLDGAGAINANELSKINTALNKLYDVTKNDEKFRPHAFSAALKTLGVAVPK